MKPRAILAALAGSLLAATTLSLVPPATALAVGGAPETATARRAAPVAWGRCEDRTLRQAHASCGLLTVPLDHADPAGPTIQLAVSRILHTKGPYRGAAFVNPGGPGASGLGAAMIGGLVPHGVGRTYDWYGIDPRGVGASVPALSCDPGYANTEHRPYRPSTAALLDYWLSRTQEYAAACGASAARALLPHMRTTDTVEDFESLRVAIGQAQVTYYGFSYGTYIGQVWATMHPGSLKAMVLDGVIDASRVWYHSNLDQDHAFQKVYSKFFRWVGRHDRIYHLGRSGRQVDRSVARLRHRLARTPAGHRIGSAEVDDMLTVAGYTNRAWPDVAAALSALLRHGDTRLVRQIVGSPHGPLADNSYAVYLATICTDAPWPEDWSVWAADNAIVEKDAPYVAWLNAWFNAPCRTWPAAGSSAAFAVSGAAYPGPVLLVNETFDAATPISGARATRALFPTARLVVGRHGTTHAASLSGVSCVDDTIARLLETGALPKRKPGDRADKTCPALAPPVLGQAG